MKLFANQLIDLLNTTRLSKIWAMITYTQMIYAAVGKRTVVVVSSHSCMRAVHVTMVTCINSLLQCGALVPRPIHLPEPVESAAIGNTHVILLLK